MNRNTYGKWGENKAKEYLLNIGYVLETENWRNRFGEIDLIMLDKDIVVFIEVKTRSNNNYGLAIESINRKKQLQIIKMAELYLQYKNWWDKTYRIDAIFIEEENKKIELKHIKNAMEF